MKPPDVGAAYDPDGPPPRSGVHLLEASAGTGKTYTIAKLIGRYVAEVGVPVDRILAMTFSRSATAELRDRVRTELRRYAADSDDAQHCDRARAALAGFDDACIMTIHEFCVDAFARFGLRADADPDEILVEDLSDIVAEATSDAYLSLFWRTPPDAEPDAKGRFRTDALTPGSAQKIAGSLIANPDAELLTEPEVALAPERERIAFAHHVRAAVESRKRSSGTVSFDDLVLRLRRAVQSDPDVRRRLRRRFSVVLVDEFQDTDPSQWAIVRDAFVEPDPSDPAVGGPAVILIGDPKQGIYSFRGADIHSYTSARDTTGTRLSTLSTNYRSDGPVIAGVLDLLGGLELGDGITVGAVQAHHTGTRISGPAMDPSGRRVRLRVLNTPDKTPAGEVAAIVARDVAGEILRTLAQGAAIGAAPGSSAAPGPGGLAPRDFAVIVRTNAQAETMRSALSGVGLPAVVNSRTSVFATPAAGAWLALLRAMERSTAAHLRAAALTDFLGVPAADLALQQEQTVASTAEEVRHLTRQFDRHGIPGIVAATAQPSGHAEATGAGMLARVLARSDGERTLTDLRHVAGLLHEEERRTRCGLTQLLDWLEDAVESADAEDDTHAEALIRRLETDADAVQVMTIHRCKGLQFPIVYAPFGYIASRNQDSAVICSTDEGTDPPRRRRVIDVRSYTTGSKLPHKQSATMRLKAERDAESQAEELRMLYVAMTRGIHEVVVTWARHTSTPRSPLHRALSAQGGVPHRDYSCDAAPLAKAEDSPNVIVESIDAGAQPLPDPTRAPRRDPAAGLTAEDLVAAPFDRSDIDGSWNRLSFTALTRGAPHGPLTRSDPAESDADALAEKDDEDDVQATSAATPTDLAGIGLDAASPFHAMPAGTAFGTLVHAVLEHLDTDTPDLRAELRLRCEEQLGIRPVAGLDADGLAEALLPTLRTPLGRLAPEASLAGVPSRDRVPELEFELPLQQGQDPATTVADIGRLLERQAAEPAWVRAYGGSLRGSQFGWKQLRGYLTGSIDAVLGIDARYFVVDYKTNLLGPPGGTLRDYRAGALPKAMTGAHYPLQALLYAAALHRFLQLRLGDYDPQRHLGGVWYLFLRGMAGPDTPVDTNGDPCGVFSWRPGTSLVVGVSDLLGGAR